MTSEFNMGEQKHRTMIQQFLEQRGLLRIAFSHTIGTVEGLMGGRVIVKARWGMNPGAKKASTRGVELGVVSGYERGDEGTAYLDLEEIAPLTKSLDFMRSTTGEWPTVDPDFAEMAVGTKSGFQLGIVKLDSGEQGFINSGGIPQRFVFMHTVALIELGGVLTEAAALLETK